MRASSFDPLLPALLAITLAATAGCSFDSSALDARPPCTNDQDCEGGVCIGGECIGVDDSLDAADIGGDLSFDVPFGDADVELPDSADGGDGEPGDGLVCSPGVRQCVGAISQVCSADGTELAIIDCETAPECAAADFGCRCDRGVCERRECRPGTRRCDDAYVLACDDAGRGFDEVELCGDDMVCIGGSCIEPVCTPGESFCAGAAIVDCAETGRPSVRRDCGAEGAYCDEEPLPSCEPRSCPPLSYRCSDDQSAIERCDSRGAEYLELEICDEGYYCEDSTCVEMACEPGWQRCTGPRVYGSCDDIGQEETSEVCPEGTYCDALDGLVVCLDRTCGPGSRRCAAEGEMVEICDERGAGYTVVLPCDDGQLCLGGVCEDALCDPATVRCVGDFSYAICDDRGASAEIIICDEGSYCDGSTGTATCATQTCVPGARRCEYPTQVRICDSRGSGFTETEICSEDHICVDGDCLPLVCTP